MKVPKIEKKQRKSALKGSGRSLNHSLIQQKTNDSLLSSRKNRDQNESINNLSWIATNAEEFEFNEQQIIQG